MRPLQVSNQFRGMQAKDCVEKAWFPEPSSADGLVNSFRRNMNWNCVGNEPDQFRSFTFIQSANIEYQKMTTAARCREPSCTACCFLLVSQKWFHIFWLLRLLIFNVCRLDERERTKSIRLISYAVSVYITIQLKPSAAEGPGSHAFSTQTFACIQRNWFETCRGRINTLLRPRTAMGDTNQPCS